MADNKVTIPIETPYDGSGLNQAQKDLKKTADEAEKTGKAAEQAGDAGNTGFSSMAVGIGKALGALAAAKGILDFFASSVTAANENARAVNTLSAAYQAVGYTASGAMKQAQDFATKMQNMTGIADEAFLNAQRLLANYGVVGTKAQEAIQAAYALSIGKNMDFAAAMDIVSKAAVGQTQTLSRYGIQIDKNTQDGEKFDAVLSKINERFGATAQAAMGDSITKTNALKESWGDFKEQIGKGLNEGLAPVLDWLAKGVGFLNKAFKSLGAVFSIIFDQMQIELVRNKQGFYQFVEGALTALKPLVYLLGKIPKIGDGITEAYARARASVSASEESLGRQVETLEKMRTPLSAIWKTEEKITEEQQYRLDLQAQEINSRVANERSAQEQLTEEVRKGVEERAAIEEESAVKRQDNEQKVLNFSQRAGVLYEKTQSDNFKNTKEFFGEIGKLAASENKKLAEIGKAGSIAQATINTYEGATKALAQGGFYGIAMAAAVIAAGLSQVAQISSVKLAEGGLVKAVTGGVPAVIGEGGSDEAVLPLDDRKAMRRIGGAIAEEGGSMGGVVLTQNITIQAGESLIPEITNALRNATVDALEMANLAVKVGNEQQGLSV